VPFVEEGLELGEPVMVAMIDEHSSWLRDALGSQADEVRFVDMRVLGRNPATIIPGWQHFLDAEGADSRPTRGIGEPIWAGRRSEEVLECQLHEALLNVAVDPKVPFWLICPYDVGHLDAAVIEEAHRSHPAIIETNSYQGSPRYRGRAHVDEMLAAPLDRPPGRPVQIPFSARNLSRLVSFVKLEGHVAGLSPEQAADLASATHRLASSEGRRAAPFASGAMARPSSATSSTTHSSMTRSPGGARRTRTIRMDSGRPISCATWSSCAPHPTGPSFGSTPGGGPSRG